MVRLFAQAVLLGAVGLGARVLLLFAESRIDGVVQLDRTGRVTMSFSARLPAFAMTTATHGMTPARTIGMTASQVCQKDHTSTAPMKNTTRTAICHTYRDRRCARSCSGESGSDVMLWVVFIRCSFLFPTTSLSPRAPSRLRRARTRCAYRLRYARPGVSAV
ncbi:hypothetical protein P9139_14945 [Curtobacterium flaccumfaciens]|nr:hypothetical protein P9139_14945 [Curtobacterium flaccumfaciens]